MSNDVTPTPPASALISTSNSAPVPVPTAPLPGSPAPFIDLPHDTRQANIIICGGFCFGIASVFVALRFYTRGWIIRVLGPSDWSILLALLFSAATTAGLIEQATLGSGRHVWDLNPTDISSGMRWGRSAWMGILFYLLSLCFSKISILLLYIHIFAFKWARTAGQYLLGIVVIASIYMLIITCTACIPLQSFWDWTLEKKYCHPQSVWWGNTGIHMVTDFLIFLIPMPVVWSIMLPKKQKIMLFGVFGLGFIVCFISILRLLQLIQTENHRDDFTWAAVELSYLTAVEINGAIVVACVMTLKPFIVRHFPSLLISGRTRRGSNSSSGGSSSGSPPSPSRHRGGHAGHGNGQGRRGSQNLMDRPPTIGSGPSKRPIRTSPMSDLTSTIDGELMGNFVAGTGTGTNNDINARTSLNKSRGSLQLAAAAAAQVWRTTTGGDGKGNRDGNMERENRNSTGYMELDDDSWVVDVEMAEGIRSGKERYEMDGEDISEGTKRTVVGRSGIERETVGESDRRRHTATSLDTGTGLGVKKKNSTRSSNDSGATKIPPTDTDLYTGPVLLGSGADGAGSKDVERGVFPPVFVSGVDVK